MDTASEDDENVELNSSKTSSLLLPTINDKNFVNNAEFKDNFLRLTSMVRRVYFSYLYKSLLSNYAISCTAKGVQDFDYRVKNCASQMELFAVRNALETSLYRKAMLKLISDVKEHTNEQKLYKNLSTFLSTSPEKADVAIQTDKISICNNEPEPVDAQAKDETISASGLHNLSEKNDDQIVTIKNEFLNSKPETELVSQVETPIDSKNQCASVFNDVKVECPGGTDSTTNNANLVLTGNPNENWKNTFNESTMSKTDDSQDSLFQTMEDMFCESDDSSDLMTLIEKHSSNHVGNSVSQVSLQTDLHNSKTNVEKKFNSHQGKRKTSSNAANALKAKKRNMRNSPVGFNDLKSPKFRKKVNEIWLVERVHQSSRLKSTMLEISLLDYRKYGRIKDKFIQLFGEADDEDAMPESPVCIEEHLQACKERIAPWIVKHLTPFFNQKRISSRGLFKTICRHITDMLIINNTFPDEASVEHYIKDFFKNKKSIQTEADIYL